MPGIDRKAGSRAHLRTALSTLAISLGVSAAADASPPAASDESAREAGPSHQIKASSRIEKQTSAQHKVQGRLETSNQAKAESLQHKQQSPASTQSKTQSSQSKIQGPN